MLTENLAYALIQVLHNFGAVTVASGTAFALWTLADQPAREVQLARIVSIGWGIQIVSGACFGAVSYYNYGQFPDLHNVAVAALMVKIACAVGGLFLTMGLMLRGALRNPHRRRFAWHVNGALVILALTSAAFLRWFA